MKRCLCFLALLTAAGRAVPVSEVPELAEIWEGNRYFFPLVMDVPVALLPEGFSELVVAGVPTGDLEMTLYLLGDGPVGTYVLASGPYQGEYNFAKSYAYWEADRSVLSVGFQMPFSARYAGAEYSWQGDELVPVDWYAGDPSLDAVDEIGRLLASGDIAEAAWRLGNIMYPGHYYDEGEMLVRFLTSAHEHALEEYGNEDPAGAVQLFREAEEAMDFIYMRYPWYRAFEDTERFEGSNLAPHITLGKFVQIANDYGFFLEQAGMYEEAVDVLYGVLTLAPDRMVAYLNLGDALWGLGEHGNAVNEYLIYSRTMEEVGLEEQIPERVGRRIRETPPTRQ